MAALPAITDANAFHITRHVMAGERVVTPGLREAKAVMLVTGGHKDVWIAPATFDIYSEFSDRPRSQVFPALAPAVMSTLMRAMGIARLNGATVGLVQNHRVLGAFFCRRSAVWIVPTAARIRIAVRPIPDHVDIDGLPMPISSEGSWSLPALLPNEPPRPRRYLDNVDKWPCPHCGEAPVRFRVLRCDALVCLECGRSSNSRLAR